jgi:hypothetical protein
MRAFYSLAVVGFLGLALSGCAVAEVAEAGVDVATTVVSTTVHVAKGAVDTVSDSSDDDKDSEKDSGKGKDSSDDDDKDK